MAGTNIIDIIIKATNKTRQALREPINDLGDLKGALVGASAMWAAAGSAALAAGAVLAKQALDAGDKALEMSQKLGITTEAFTTLEFAARQSNLSSEQFSAALQKLSVNAGQAALGSKQSADNFKAIGVSVTDAHGRMLPMDQILLKVADRFSQMPDGALKAKVAVDLFGKAGVDLVPMLNQGAAGIAGLQARARQLGLEISGPAAQASDQFKDNLDQLKDSSAGLGRTFMADILPGMNAILDGFIKGQGLGQAWNFVMGTLGLAVSGVLKIIMSLVVEVDREIEYAGARIAQLAATIAGVAVNGIKGARDAWKAGSEEIDRINQSAADRHAAIWTGTQVGPPPPDPAVTRQGAEEILKVHEEVKVALDTQRLAEMEAIKEFDRQTIESRLAVLDAKRMLNQQEAEEYRALKQQMSAIDKAATEQKKKSSTDEKQAYDRMLNDLVSLANSKNQVLVGIAKTASIARATMHTYEGATLARASVPPPFGFAVAGAIIAAGLANVATIAGVPGFAAGGVVPGTDFSGDRRLIRVNSAEEVLTTQDRRDTTAALLGALEALRGGGGGGAGRAQLNIDGRTLGEIIYEGTVQGWIQIHPRAVRVA